MRQDGLLAARILASLFKQDDVSYKLVPVGSYSELQIKRDEALASEEVRVATPSIIGKAQLCLAADGRRSTPSSSYLWDPSSPSPNTLNFPEAVTCTSLIRTDRGTWPICLASSWISIPKKTMGMTRMRRRRQGEGCGCGVMGMSRSWER